jgi:hypothetical protein
MSSHPAFRNVAWRLALLPFVCLPLGSLAAWHYGDTRIPNDDAGQYTQTAAEIYRPLSDGKPLKFVERLYLKRGFRPVTLPCFAALCLPLAGGDLKTATALALGGFYALLFGYSFLLLRTSTTVSAAAIGAALAATLPWILQYSAVFFADVPMVAAMVAALYHAKRCENWTSFRHGAALGCALALAISLRPIEPLPAAATLLAFLLLGGYRSKRIGLPDLRVASVLLVPLVALLLLGACSILRSKLLAAGLFCPSLIVYARLVRRSQPPLNRCFAACAAALLGGIGLWYLPAARATWSWVWSCSFGDLNRLYKGVGELDFRGALWLIGSNLGGVQLAALATLAGGALLASLLTRRPALSMPRALRPPEPRVPGALILGAGFLQVALVILLAAITPGTDLRRGYVGFYWMFLGLTIYATSPLVKGYRLRTAALGGLTAAQLATVAFSAIGQVPDALQSTAQITHAVYPSQQRWKDKTLRTFDEVLDRVPGACDVAAMTVAINAYSERVFDLSALNAISSIKKSTVRFGCPCIFDTLAEGYRELENYPFVLVDTRAILPTISEQKRHEPYSRLSEDLAARYRRRRIVEVGLKERAKFTIDGVEVVILEWIAGRQTANRPAGHRAY